MCILIKLILSNNQGYRIIPTLLVNYPNICLCCSLDPELQSFQTRPLAKVWLFRLMAFFSVQFLNAGLSGSDGLWIQIKALHVYCGWGTARRSVCWILSSLFGRNLSNCIWMFLFISRELVWYHDADRSLLCSSRCAKIVSMLWEASGSENKRECF